MYKTFYSLGCVTYQVNVNQLADRDDLEVDFFLIFSLAWRWLINCLNDPILWLGQIKCAYMIFIAWNLFYALTSGCLPFKQNKTKQKYTKQTNQFQCEIQNVLGHGTISLITCSIEYVQHKFAWTSWNVNYELCVLSLIRRRKLIDWK